VKHTPAPLRVIPELHRATHRVGLHLERGAGLGVTQAEAHILAHLASAGECTVAELHRALAHRRSTLTSVLDRLVARGLATRETSPQDRRSFVVRLTPPGRTCARRVHAALDSIERKALAGRSAAEVRAIATLLTRLA
jgi:DNA-binding MarR family transcriptional regulator